MNRRISWSSWLIAVGCLLALFGMSDVAQAAEKKPAFGVPGVLQLKSGGRAHYYRSRAVGQQPVLVYLHGRGGNPQNDCHKWANVATRFGWLVCPEGPNDLGGGKRSWGNDAGAGRRVSLAAIEAIREKYGRKAQLYGNVLIGFSEGAFVAMQVGLAEPKAFNRWLILGANDRYWFGDAQKKLDKVKRRLHRVYLWTGEGDGVAPNTKKVAGILRGAGVPVRVRFRHGVGHKIPANEMLTNYYRALIWLTAG